MISKSSSCIRQNFDFFDYMLNFQIKKHKEKQLTKDGEVIGYG